MRLRILVLLLIFCGAAYSWQEPGADIVARTELAALTKLVNQRFDDQEKAVGAALAQQEKAVAAALSASKEAVGKAEVAAEKRFDAVNEFRGTLKDQQQLFIQRVEAEQRFSQLTERVGALQARIDKAEGGGIGQSALWQYIIAAIGVAIGIFGAFHLLTASKKGSK